MLSDLSDQQKALLSGLAEAWGDNDDLPFADLLLSLLPEEDTFWVTDEQFIAILNGEDPFAFEDET